MKQSFFERLASLADHFDALELKKEADLIDELIVVGSLKHYAYPLMEVAEHLEEASQNLTAYFRKYLRSALPYQSVSRDVDIFIEESRKFSSDISKTLQQAAIDAKSLAKAFGTSQKPGEEKPAQKESPKKNSTKKEKPGKPKGPLSPGWKDPNPNVAPALPRPKSNEWHPTTPPGWNRGASLDRLALQVPEEPQLEGPPALLEESIKYLEENVLSHLKKAANVETPHFLPEKLREHEEKYDNVKRMISVFIRFVTEYIEKVKTRQQSLKEDIKPKQKTEEKKPEKEPTSVDEIP